MKNRVRAIIIQNTKILLIKRIKPNLVYWVVPGGGVEENETNESALQRECLEELGVQVKVKELVLAMDSKKLETIGQRESFYLCSIMSGVLGSGNGPEFQLDAGYVGEYIIEWIDIKNLLKINLKPDEIKNLLYEKYK